MYLWSCAWEERFRPQRGLPTVATGETRGIRKPQLSAIDPGGVDHLQRFQEIGGPLLGVHSVTVILIFPWASAHGYYWVAPAGLGAVPPSNAYEEICKSSQFLENELVELACTATLQLTAI